MKEFESRGLSTAGAVVVAVVILIAVGAVLYFAPGATPAATSSQSTAASSSSTAALTTITSSTTTSTISTTTPSTSTTSVRVVTTIISASQVQVTIPLGVGTNMSLNFEPSSLTVVIGVNNTIEWVDQDSSAPHTVTATSVPSGAAMFNSGESTPLNKGSTFSVTLTIPGTYHYHCSFHPSWMMGTIVVKQG